VHVNENSQTRQPRVVTGTVHAELEAIGAGPGGGTIDVPIEDVAPIVLPDDEHVLAALFFGEQQQSHWHAGLPGAGLTVYAHLPAVVDRVRILRGNADQIDILTAIADVVAGQVVTVPRGPWAVHRSLIVPAIVAAP
jgi:hypothetical protein